jgi:hypothetical protein
MEREEEKENYMRCYCGSWVVCYHLECLALAPPRREDEDEEVRWTG